MTNPNQPGVNPTEDLRAYLARMAAGAAAEQQSTVEAATTHFRDVAATALTGLDRVAEEVHELPPQTRESLGPLWPGADNQA